MYALLVLNKKATDWVRWQPIKTEQEGSGREACGENGRVLNCITDLSGAL